MLKPIDQTNFHFPGQTAFYRGKVRDVYTLGDRLIMIASDRISAFDHILPRAIPYKGQVLNQIAVKFLEMSRSIVPNWLISSPDPNVCIGKRCNPFKVEMVIRGYLAGHAWREYRIGKRSICGVTLPEGLNENDRLPIPILTPTTKADEGHDLDISAEEIIRQGIVSEAHYRLLEKYSHQLYELGSAEAAKRGLILVDTKYEFGLYENEVLLMDEVHTPDSSRYFYADSYETNQRQGVPQKHLSKEFVRQWLIENGFQGLEGQEMPMMSDEVVEQISQRYIELYERITGERFIAAEGSEAIERIEQNIRKVL